VFVAAFAFFDVFVRDDAVLHMRSGSRWPPRRPGAVGAGGAFAAGAGLMFADAEVEEFEVGFEFWFEFWFEVEPVAAIVFVRELGLEFELKLGLLP